MAAGDPYFDCNNRNLSLDSVLRDMIVKDAAGKPAWRTNATGGGGGGGDVSLADFETEPHTGYSGPTVALLQTPGKIISFNRNGQILIEGIGFNLVGSTITPTLSGGGAFLGDDIEIKYIKS